MANRAISAIPQLFGCGHGAGLSILLARAF
jgi:hypothetical protein